jgi:hypothetical protein
MLLIEALPEFARELQLLLQVQEPELASQLPALKIVETCGCEDAFCAYFYTQPRPKQAYGANHHTVILNSPAPAMLLLDVVDGIISFVEVLNRPDVRQNLVALGLQP